MATLFTGQTPVLADNNDGAPGITTGTTLSFATAGTVPAIRFYATTTVSGTYTVALWRVIDHDPGNLGTLLASKTLSGPPTAGTWNTITLDVPVGVLVGGFGGALYRAGVYSGAGRYVATTGFFTGGALTNGDITAPQHNTDPAGLGTLLQGSFSINAALTYPQSGNGACYFVDVDFIAAGAGQSVSPASLSVPVSLGSPSVSSLLSVSPPALSVPVSLGAVSVSSAVSPPAPSPVGGGGWRRLQSIVNQARRERAEDLAAAPLSCPNDGEPLRTSIHGIRYCPYDGWKPQDQHR